MAPGCVLPRGGGVRRRRRRRRAWTATRTLDRLFTAVSPVRTGSASGIRDVEAHLATLASAPHVDSGVVRAVVPEARRGHGRLLARLQRRPASGSTWYFRSRATRRRSRCGPPSPDRLTAGRSSNASPPPAASPPERISDAVGEEVAVKRLDDRWVVGAPRVGTPTRDDSARSWVTETDRR
ncbi:hypothetical protein [Halogeometricum sp. CBA1124]|uniref:hypothetical protein n=1 Tax=Halogeometricum sp. CBA1124 TaxID=2668071 RepID=UPI001429C8DE|nr:hypothetical protein [Halogeometricum sp. CBA1124]MUV58782.1 hypothetical protein [Halogeometricum sp. CBA1124]